MTKKKNKGQFQKDCSGNPRGRPKGSINGIKKARGFIAEVMRLASVRRVMYDAILDYAMNEPLPFYMAFIHKNEDPDILKIEGDVMKPIVVNIIEEKKVKKVKKKK